MWPIKEAKFGKELKSVELLFVMYAFKYQALIQYVKYFNIV